MFALGSLGFGGLRGFRLFEFCSFRGLQYSHPSAQKNPKDLNQQVLLHKAIIVRVIKKYYNNGKQ